MKRILNPGYPAVALFLALALAGCEGAGADGTDATVGADPLSEGPGAQDIRADAAGDLPVDDPATASDQPDGGAGPEGAVPDAPVDTADGGPWACVPGAATRTLTFVHVNDLHSRYTPSPDGNPFARLAGYVAQVRQENPFTIFTDGGDDHEKGCLAEQVSQGVSTVEVTRAMGFDVRVPGNHDFAWSVKEFLAHTRDPHARVVLSNVAYTGDDPLGFGAVPYAELEVGCVRLGFFGLVSGPWNDQDQPVEGDFYPELPRRPDVQAVAADIVARHRADVDLMVLVSHLGNGDDEALAAGVPGIDLILGGHSHTVLAAPTVVGATRIVQSGSGADWVTRLDVVVDLESRKATEWRHELLPNLPGLLPLDDAMDAQIAGIVDRHAKGITGTVAWLATHHGDKRLADLAARAARHSLEADAVLLDPDTTWTALRAGAVTPQALLDSFQVEREPAGTSGFSSMVRVQVSGADLARIRDGKPDWSWDGPLGEIPDGTYRLGLQKRTAARPDRHLPEGVVLADPVPTGEVWLSLLNYAIERDGLCLYLDTDDTVPGCL